MRIRRLLLVGVLWLGNYSTAQVRACLSERHTLPDDLRSTLDARLSRFLTAEAEGQWDVVAQFLGKEIANKECLVSRMQELRMARFDISSADLYTCSTQAELPSRAVDRLTAEQLSWSVRGTATFQTSSETWLEETQITAYRDHGQWYFIPPQEAPNMQRKWEEIHYTDADFNRDRRDEVEVPRVPSAPIEITDVHVFMDRQFPSLRNVKFKLHNRTSKKVIALSMRIGDSSGFQDLSGPYEIEPKGEISLEGSANGYGDSCSGTQKDSMVVTDVFFADGSKWKFKEPAGHRPD